MQPYICTDEQSDTLELLRATIGNLDYEPDLCSEDLVFEGYIDGGRVCGYLDRKGIVSWQ